VPREHDDEFLELLFYGLLIDCFFVSHWKPIFFTLLAKQNTTSANQRPLLPMMRSFFYEITIE
jgi:hypothetical protein